MLPPKAVSRGSAAGHSREVWVQVCGKQQILLITFRRHLEY